MSPRAACRLETLGYDAYDYAPGKVDWMAHGLPVEGSLAARPTALSLILEEVATCALEDRAGEIEQRIDPTPYEFAVALSSSGVVLGRVRRSALKGADPAARVQALMESGPSTIRPHLTIDELSKRLARSDVRTLIVTDPEGKLLGVVRRRDVEDV
ncbi:MAG TPA: CBS domain-containing protein [Solirubrobacteraceae bacterium]|nr:CBS domain-containing protein [Solirubrobacteraceae bacterium]